MPMENEANVLIIGNGFDLAHFLPTSYGEFINFVKILDGLEGDLSDVKFDEVFKEKTDDQPGFSTNWLSSVRKYYDTENMRFNLSKLKDRLNNAWLEYFKPIHEIETWIDFEGEINNALSTVAEYINFSKQIISDGEVFQRVRSWKGEGHDFFHREKTIKLSRLKLLQPQSGHGVNHDNPDTADHYKVNNAFYKNGDIHGILGVSESKIIDYLYKELEIFILLFNTYLIEVVDKFSKKVKFDFLENIKIFNDIYSFNYTNTINNLYNKKIGIWHMHGSIQNLNESNIVLGVNEVDTSVLGTSALSFTKYFQTLFKETDFEFLDDLASQANINSEGTDYFIWGHSLDRSDEKYIKRLFQEISFDLAESGEVAYDITRNDAGREIHYPLSFITVYYHSQSAKARLLKNLLDIIGKEVIERSMISGHLKFDLAPRVWKDVI